MPRASITHSGRRAFHLLELHRATHYVFERANSRYEGGYGAGIYVDGGRDIVIENNLVTGSDLGIEIGAENNRISTSAVIVRNNLLYRNERAGLVIGGFESAAGRVTTSQFRGNTLYQNNTVGESGQGTYFVGGGISELWLQWVETSTISSNIIVAGPENVVIGSYDPGSNLSNTMAHNLYFGPDPANAEFYWNDNFFSGLAAWQIGTGQGASSTSADPLFVNAAGFDFHITVNSPARDSGDPTYVPVAGEADLDGARRVASTSVDRGVDEYDPASIFADGFESGTVSAWAP